MTSEERYYYTCMEHITDDEVHCIRDTKDFKTREFNNLSTGQYRHMTLMSLSKENMDRIHKHIPSPVPGTTLLASLTNVFNLCSTQGESGEERLMKQEFKGKPVVFINFKK